MSETDLNRAIREAAAQLGCIVIRVHSGKVQVRGGWMQCAPNGTPDHVILGPHGQVLWAESKLPGKPLRPEQKEWAAKAARLGHHVVRIDSVQALVDAIRENLDV